MKPATTIHIKTDKYNLKFNFMFLDSEEAVELAEYLAETFPMEYDEDLSTANEFPTHMDIIKALAQVIAKANAQASCKVYPINKAKEDELTLIK